MQLTNDQKIIVIENYNKYLNSKKVIEKLESLNIPKTLIQHEINCLKSNNNFLILNSKINKL